MQHQSAYTENALVSVWKRAPEHSISCLASLSPRENSQSLQQDRYLVSGSESGHICLWRQRTDEDNLHPIALVVARDKCSRVTALCTFWFEQSPVFVAAYDDGYVTVHELMLGDSIISLQVLPDEFVVRHFQVVQANVSDPFVQILCIPESHHSKIVVLRVGLGEGYQGSLSLLTTLDHVGSKVLNAVLLHRHSSAADSAGVSSLASTTTVEPVQPSQAKESDSRSLALLNHNQATAKRHSLKVCDTARSSSLPDLQMLDTDNSRAAKGNRVILLLSMCSSAILRLWSLGTVWGAMGSLKLQSREYSNVTSHQQQEQELVEFNVSPDESLLVLIWRQHWVVCQLQLLDGRRPIIVSPLMQIPQQPPTSFNSSSTRAGVSTAFFSLDGKKLFLLNFEYSCLAIFSLPTTSREWKELTADTVIEVPSEHSVSPSDRLQSRARCCFARQDDNFVYLVCNRLPSGSFFQLDLSTTLGKVRSLYSVFPSPNSQDTISTLCLLADVGDRVKIVCGFDSGRIECFALGNSAGNSISLIGHRHKVSALKRAELIFDHEKASAVSRHRVFLLSGGVDGAVFVWDSKSFAQIGKFYAHSDEIVSFRVLSSSLFAVIARDNAFSVYLAREVPVASSSGSSKTTISIRPQLLASGHDSQVRHVLRSTWCDLADYVVSVSDSDSVYIWALASGNLDRVLVGSDARVFLISRGLATGASDSANQHRQQHQLLPIGLLNSLDDLVFLGQGADRGPLVEKASRNSALGTLVGLPASLHIDVLVLDVISSLRLQKGFERKNRRKTKSDESVSLPSGEVGQVLHEHARCVLSLLLDWGVNADLESSVQWTLSLFDLQSLLQSFSSSARTAFATFGSLAHTRTSIQQQAPFSLTILLPGYRSDVGSDCDNSSALQRRWQFSHRFCALYSLYINAFSMRLMSCGVPQAQALFSRLVAGYTVVLPDTLPAFKEPSIRMLASYCLHEDEAIHVAAKILLEGVVHRMSRRRRQAIFKQWARIFDSLDLSDGSLSASPTMHLTLPDTRRSHLQRHPSRDYAMNESLSQFDVVSRSDEKLMASIVLCMVGIHSKQCSSQSASETLLFDVSLCKRLSSSLLTVIRSVSLRNSDSGGSSSSAVDQTSAGAPQLPSPVAAAAAAVSLAVPQRKHVWRGKVEQQVPCPKPALVRISLAAELFGAGARLWCSHLTDISAIFSLLLVLSHSSEKTNSATASSCQRALIEMAAVEPNAFIAAMTAKTLTTDALRSNAIMAVLLLIKKYPQSLLGRSQASIPLLAEAITSCLDPGEPTTRRVLLRPGTAVLHLLTRKYPMVAFHQRSQMFAVGSNSADKSEIVIYDLRTATKWRVLEGDFGAVWAVSFNSTGTLLASYSGGTGGGSDSRAAPSIRIWKMTTSGLISGLLGLQSECVRTIDLAPTSVRISAQQLLHNIQLSWPSAASVRLQREDRSICCFSL